MRWLGPLRRVVLAAAWTAAWGGAWAADPAKLELDLAAAPADQRTALLLRYSAEAEFTDPQQALEYARRALAAAPNPRDKLRAQVRVASSERALGDYSGAMADAKAGRDAAAAQHDDRMRAQAMLVIARTQWALSQVPGAIATFRGLLDLAGEQRDIPTEIDGHLGLGLALSDAGDKEPGRQQFLRALELAEKSGDDGRLGSALNDLGNNALDAGDTAGAQSYYERAKAAFDRAGSVWGSATAIVNLGQVAEDAGDLATALIDAQAARDIYRKLGLRRQWANAQRQMGSVLSKLGRQGESRQAFQEGLELAQGLGSHAVLANLYHEQSLALERAGEAEAALKAQRLYGAEHEAALGEKSRQQVAELNARFDAEHREREIAALRSAQVVHEAAELESRTSAYELAALLAIGVLIGTLVVGWQRIRLLAERRVAAQARLSREAAVQADRVKTRLLGIASHDLKGPLGNIHQIAEEMQREQSRAGARDERLDWVKVESARLTRLVQDLLDTAALETGRLDLRKAPLDLAEVVRAGVTELQWQVAEKRQQIVFEEPPAGAARVAGDVDRLRQVLGNILSNAVKFSPVDGKITIGLARRGDRVVLQVSDEGPGLTAEDRERIFAPFARLSAQPTGREMSYGLGLSIAQEIVRLHGGSIAVESAPGGGATFMIELPAAAGDDADLSWD